jgi:tRNA dimethylallyltransferase
MKIPRVSPQVELRQQLGKLGQGQLYQILLKIDEMAAQKIHPNDHVRTLRAVEVYYVTGKPISSQQGENPPPYPILQIGVDWEDLTVSDGQIAKRTHGMIDLGLVDEVKYLINKYGIELPLLNTLGYAEIKQYLLGEIQLEEAIDLIILHTRQFAKQQRTWFKAIPEIEWYNSGDRDLLDMVYQRINQFMKECS